MNTCSDLNNYFTGKYALVTGAASGVGLALTKQLLAFGAAKVVMADFNPATLQQESEQLAAAHPGKIDAALCNVTQEAEVQAMIRDAVTRNGRLDLLINNAGAGFSGPFAPLTDADWNKAFASNFYGALYGIRAVLPFMLEQGSGQIVNIISGIVFCPMPFQSMYSATKAALNGLTLALRAEYEIHNIRFSSATPGTTRSAIWPDNKVPDRAQDAACSALNILTGVAQNQRLITGDATDRESSELCFNAAAADEFDAYVREIARKRRAGDANAV